MTRNTRILLAELFGTFVLVIGGCGSAVLAGEKIGFLGVSIAFGLSLLVMAYTIGDISGCHINPAVSIALWVAKKTPTGELPFYLIGQILGAIVGGGVLYLIASGNPAFDISKGFATNGFGEHSPGGYSLFACAIAEIVLTFFLLFAIMGTTYPKFPTGFAGIPIGLVLILIHLVGIPVTNTSVNPARSIGVAVYQGGWAIEQLWLFIFAPIIGAILGVYAYKLFLPNRPSRVESNLEAS
ncbi:aquaporin Z [Oscillatoria sp. FACHB-1406]|uniref:aquaporin Z n=1 Tax=Oscillatoria sp. FACHB-1406 TaxID=2692846 RepID=UPI001688D0EF|nr:aquaporin Z [Oscillatoria sp. FACHB-1406]MBD2577693.1 aquaporin Z [Oscillatoria sp. FACHB-1406]